MKHQVKMGLAYTADIIALPFVYSIAYMSKFKTVEKRSIFIGTMPTSPLTMVRDGLRQKGYKVDYTVHRAPPHQANITYDTPTKIMFMPSYIRDYFIFANATWNYNIFIMPFLDRMLDRHPILRWHELPILKKIGKKIILNSYGYDVMTPKKTLGDKKYKHSILEGYAKSQRYSKVNEDYIEKNRVNCERYADHIISALDQAEYISKVDSCFHMRCVDTEAIIPKYETENEVVRIIHATNHTDLKGTEYLIKAVEELKHEGEQLELVFMEKQSRDKVLEVISKSDIVADQFIVGAYGNFAIEGMVYGKPVLCYLRENLKQWNPWWEECPIVNTTPEELKRNIKALAHSKQMRIQVGKASRKYVEKYHSIEYVVDRLDKILEGVLNEADTV